MWTELFFRLFNCVGGLVPLVSFWRFEWCLWGRQGMCSPFPIRHAKYYSQHSHLYRRSIPVGSHQMLNLSQIFCRRPEHPRQLNFFVLFFSVQNLIQLTLCLNRPILWGYRHSRLCSIAIDIESRIDAKLGGSVGSFSKIDVTKWERNIEGHGCNQGSQIRE